MERERRVWKGLENKNVLELLGVCYKPELTHDLKVMCFVSHYMKGGESTKYLKGHPETDFHRFVGIVLTPRLYQWVNSLLPDDGNCRRVELLTQRESCSW